APLPNPRRTVRMLPLPALLRTNVQALAERPVTNGGRYLVALGVAAAAAGIATAFHFDGRALPVAIGALALSGFVLADFYRLLREAHAPIRAFLATLPVSPRSLMTRDVVTVLCLGAVPYLMLAVWFGAFDPGSLVAFGLLAVAYAGRTIFAGLDLSLDAGTYALTGRNGTGKSTLLRLLSGAQRPSAGRVSIDGHDLVRDPIAARQRLSYVPDESPAYPFMTGAELLHLVSTARRAGPDPLVDELVTAFGLAAHLGARFDAISLGTQKKLLLAAGWIGRPRVILLDEPSNA